MMDSAQINGLEIAIIGMVGRFPGAKNVDEFWRNIRDGIESISFLTDRELKDLGIDSAELSNPNYVRANGVIEDLECFDASFFGYSPREAEVMDPQHRLLLEQAWEALELAGYSSEAYKGAIGVFAGTNSGSYLFNIYSNHDILDSIDDFQISIGNDSDYLTTRISYKLNLDGPSYTVQTGCSTSLVAVHLACQSLFSGECDLALAGGVSILKPTGYLYQKGGLYSPDGHCRTFDAKAEGSVQGRGLGIVVLKRLEDAIADRDCIHAVIKGSAINNDGSSKVSYTAPSIDGQAKVIRAAQDMAEVEPETITYIEAHGTATALGDPIEMAALAQAFCRRTQKKGFCAIGSVKTNIGHLGPAAGVAGLIKTVLALKHKQIPPSLHFETANPQIDFANSPFYVNTRLSEWKTNGTSRRAGVSSFGIGGTNAHVIVEEAPQQEPSRTSRPWQLLVLSAKTNSALEKTTSNLIHHFQQHSDLNLADVAYTLQMGRRAFEHRRMVVCRDLEDGIAALQDSKRVFNRMRERTTRSVAFMFTGLGTHYIHMAGELYQVEPSFRQTIDSCCEFLKPLLGLDLREVLYPCRNPAEGVPQSSGLDLRQMLRRNAEPLDKATEKLNQTYLSQPALFVIEYALAQLWISWGIRPAAMIGYSIGEYVAATLAGVMSLPEALRLVAKRAQLIQQLPEGAMLAVPLSEEQLYPLLGEKLSLSAVNGPQLCVVAGANDAVENLERQLGERNVSCQRVQASHAFHSCMMEAIAHPFTEVVKTISLQPPQIPYLSNVTGTWISAEQATDPNYWSQHLCQPVRFADGVCQLWEQQHPILLEVGPGQMLTSLALQCLGREDTPEKVVLPSLRHDYDHQSDMAFLLKGLGQLWLSGVEINWEEFSAHEHRHRLPLPTYPFERQRYWLEPRKKTFDIKFNQEALAQRLDINEWFYIPSWKQTAPPAFSESRASIAQNWLVFVDECGVGSQLIEELKSNGRDIVTVRIGEQFCRINEWEYTINPQQKDDYDALIKNLHTSDQIPQIIAHLWNITTNTDASSSISSRLECAEKAQKLGFYSLLFIAQALGKQKITNSLHIGVISNDMQELIGEQESCPEKATLLGTCKAISQEYSNILCRSIDITLPQAGTRQWKQMIHQLLAELAGEPSDQVVAYRGNHRWVQDFEAFPVKDKTLRQARLREAGVYVITGGLGGLGLIVSEYLAKTVRARLVLIGRSGLPPKTQWQQWLSSHDELNLVSQQIKKVQALEEFGSEVLLIKANVADLEQMQAMVNQVHDRFGRIHGVIHAAGMASREFIQVKTPEIAASVLDPKVKGTLVLDTVLKDEKLDFLVLFSSLGSIVGGFGQSDYCAASAFLDAFAHYNFFRREGLTVSINWDHWKVNNLQDLAMSFAPEVQAALKKSRDQSGISPQEGMDVLSHVLSVAVPQVLVSTRNLKFVIEQERSLLSTVAHQLENLEKTRSESKQKRPDLKTDYVAPRNEIECRIADIYQELLGIDRVGINDNFFDLGGHSLTGIQLISKLRQNFQVELSVPSLFESPSVAELALVVEEMLIGELEELTEHQAEEFLSSIES
jgi:acyl transferase domain-containing protein/acyl carrier protein